VFGKRKGNLAVCYLEEKPGIDEDPFLKEERNLINAIADTLGKTIERKIAEEERAKLETKLSQIQRIEAMGTLAGGIAHDFNNILSVIIGNIELAINDAAKNTGLHRNLRQVLKAGNRARDLVQQILAFSRQDKQELKHLQVNPIAKETIRLLSACLPSTIDIRQDIRSDSVVFADSTQIHQVIMNLCTNADYAMREKGGILEIKLEDVKLDPDFAVKHPGIKPGSFLKLTVSDTGCGMAPGVLNRVFEPLFTTKKGSEGTGMGLSVVHGIVKSYGGTITVYSEPGKGSTFNVFLPISKGAAAKQAVSREPLPIGTERILFIDDQLPLVEMGKQMFESLGYEVVTRTGSIEALELFKRQPGRFDLVITDLTMPKLTGDQLSKKIIRIRPDIPIILCTGFSPTINKKEAKDMGIREFVLKPLLKKDIAVIIRKVLDEC
jgi:signal transduction histidine kinase